MELLQIYYKRNILLKFVTVLPDLWDFLENISNPITFACNLMIYEKQVKYIFLWFF